MAIKKISENHEGLQVNINNGDLKALNEIKDGWGFKDQESVLRFALATLSITEDGTLQVIKKDGTVRSIRPIEELLSS